MRTPPSLLACMMVLGAVRMHLRLFGFGRTLARVRALAARAAVGGAADDGLVSGSVKAVAVAAAFFPGRAICLEQSLALYLLLRRRGVAAELRLGAKPFPFAAHAWVEVAGEPVDEVAEAIAAYLPFPEPGT